MSQRASRACLKHIAVEILRAEVRIPGPNPTTGKQPFYIIRIHKKATSLAESAKKEINPWSNTHLIGFFLKPFKGIFQKLSRQIVVWSTIPVDTDWGKIKESQELSQWISMVVHGQGQRREPGGRPERALARGASVFPPGGKSRSSCVYTR